MFGALLDTFHDRRNGFNFYTNPLGARADQVVTNEGNPNADWNPVWFVRTGRFEGGWTVEMAIPVPLDPLRLGCGSGVGPADPSLDPPQERVDAPDLRAGRHRRRDQHLPRLGRGDAGRPRPAAGGEERRAEALRHLQADHATGCASPAVDNDSTATAGRRRQVRHQRQPDRRPHHQHRLRAGGSGRAAGEPHPLPRGVSREARLLPRGPRHVRVRPPVGPGRLQRPDRRSATNAPQLFFTRRIGLNNGREVPILAGGRVTGTVGKTARRRDEHGDRLRIADRPRPGRLCGRPTPPARRAPTSRWCGCAATSCAAATIGVIFTNRSNSPTVDGANQAYGVDASFSFFQNVTANAYYARSESPKRTATRTAYQARVDYGGDRYGAAPRLSRRRRQLLPGDRLRAAARLRPHLRLGPLQPADAQQPAWCAATSFEVARRVRRQPQPPRRVEPARRPAS